MAKLFELIRPRSLTVPEYEDFEYLIRWIGRDGSEYLYMFLDAEFEQDIDSKVINRESSSNIESLIDSISRAMRLKADDLSLNDLKIIGQIFENKYVTRILKDGTFERYAPVQNSLEYRLMDGRYELSIKLALSDVTKCR